MQISEAELKAQIEEEMAKFKEDGYFTRLGKMFKGLGMPKDTKEYKIAAIELQRQLAPISAFLIVGLLVLTGILLALFSKKPEQKAFQIATATPVAEDDTEQEEPPPPPEEPPKPPDVPDEVPVTTTDIGTPSTVVTPQPVAMASVQPSPVDAVMNIKSPITLTSIASGRTPGRRGQMTTGGPGYGDPMTEAAVMRALRWLKYTQAKDGSWHVNLKNGTILDRDRGREQAAMVPLANTAFALLCYLAHGEGTSPKSSPEFHETVTKAINYLISKGYTDSNGLYRFHGSDENEYAFLIAVYALCEAYGMTHNPEIKEVAEKGVERIIKGQLKSGGWDYTLGRNPKHKSSDISLGGWAIQALKAAKLANIHHPELQSCINRAMNCFAKDNWNAGEKVFTYKPRSGRRYYLSPVGCLAYQLLGRRSDHTVLATLKHMKDWVPTFDRKAPPNKTYAAHWSAPQYYMYYATQCKFQAGMNPNHTKEDFDLWAKWNQAMKELYPKTQRRCTQKIKDANGNMRDIGYWVNSDTWSTRPVMDTCLCALQLMVYYRYLPTTAETVKETGIQESIEQATTEADDAQVNADDI